LFSVTFRYALISLLDIAGTREGINTTTIAQRHGIPGTYLANVLRDLRRLGLVKSLKGRRGGYLLAKPAEEIDLLALQQGLAGSGDAAQAGGAATHGAELWLQQLEARWRQDLAATSLRDIQRSVAASNPLAEPQASEEANS
jgi:Rrf2 family protein